MGCLMRIRAARESFTPSEAKIAAFIAGNVEDAVNVTTQELAGRSGVSPATVVRFSRMLGYESFAEMNADLLKDLESDEEPMMELLLNTQDDLSVMSQKALSNVTMAISSMLAMLRYKDLEEAIELLQHAEHIYLYGIGASGIVATDFMQKLVRVNYKCLYYSDQDLGVVASTFLSERDVVVAFSYGGRTKEVNFAVKNARAKGAKCIAVTKFGKNPLATLADIVLPLPSIEREVRIGALASRYAQLFVVDLLYLGIVRGDMARTHEYLETTRGLIEVFKETE